MVLIANYKRKKMNKIISLIAAMIMTCSCTPNARQANTISIKNEKVLVAYFSATGNTETEAKLIASVVKGDIHKIQPVKEYSPADLDWEDESSRCCKEFANPASRPAISLTLGNLSEYDIVFLGFPIWWDQAPRIINTFMESADFAGKTVIPFATSGGSGIDNAEKELREMYPKVMWQKGKLLNGDTKKDIEEWINN